MSALADRLDLDDQEGPPFHNTAGLDGRSRIPAELSPEGQVVRTISGILMDPRSPLVRDRRSLVDTTVTRMRTLLGMRVHAQRHVRMVFGARFRDAVGQADLVA
jgi:hypothetical protein